MDKKVKMSEAKGLSLLLIDLVMDGKERLLLLNDFDVSKKPSLDKWSKKEILGHLIDSTLNNHRRILLSFSQSDLVFSGYDQDQWVRLNNYQSQNWEFVVDTYVNLNVLLSHTIANIDDPHLTMNKEHNFDKISMVKIEAYTPANLKHLITDYLYHMEHHLRQILT